MRITLTLLIYLSMRVVHGQCCSGGVPMSGNLGLPAADKGTFQGSLSYDLNNLETLKQGGEKLNDQSRQRQTHSTLLKLGYTFSSKFSIDGFLSYIRQERIISNSFGSNKTVTNGLGDAVVMLKYRLNTQLTFGYGLKIPLGPSDLKNESGLNLNADLQPGSGAWDNIIYLNYSIQTDFRPTLSYFGTSIYRITGKNREYFTDSVYEFGDELQLIIGASDRLLLFGLVVDPSVKLRFRHAGRDQFDNNNFPGSGGVFLFASPGISWNISSKISSQASLEIPIYSKVNETQLSPTYRINLGVSFRIEPETDIELNF